MTSKSYFIVIFHPENFALNPFNHFIVVKKLSLICAYLQAKLLQLCPLCVTPLTIACQAPLSMGFSKQEYWRGMTFSSPGDLPDPGIKPTSLTTHALASGFFTTSTSLEAILDIVFLNLVI